MQRRTFIHRTLQDITDAGQVHEAATKTWISRRYTLRKDGMGFSFHWTTLKEGTSTLIWYKNHHEAVFVFAGEGEIEVVTPEQSEGEGTVYKLGPGDFYGLDGHERHFLRATKGDLHVACAFNPPIAGSEDHNEDGVYPAVDDEGNKHFDLTPEVVSKLVQPPKTMR
ncbi:hypothetical protein FNF31_04187 [Cafeteria roenbergensis]|nr:hypothetical protein FNF28_05458 [Cafeteria roenbergensis]KAA0160636.1 hypothetical protein FNF31_04187 [Cafeteria roenbergensis]